MRALRAARLAQEVVEVARLALTARPVLHSAQQQQQIHQTHNLTINITFSFIFLHKKSNKCARNRLKNGKINFLLAFLPFLQMMSFCLCFH